MTQSACCRSKSCEVNVIEYWFYVVGSFNPCNSFGEFAIIRQKDNSLHAIAHANRCHILTTRRRSPFAPMLIRFRSNSSLPNITIDSSLYSNYIGPRERRLKQCSAAKHDRSGSRGKGYDGLAPVYYAHNAHSIRKKQKREDGFYDLLKNQLARLLPLPSFC